ncbi:response regulator transcription factor [Singulisphaera sp. PoT]|uniref:response regulator transcription factor n=1 Tax=Singulisphaera sp. PoT TaxID=3411797 RepID=UPI003BF6084E
MATSTWNKARQFEPKTNEQASPGQLASMSASILLIDDDLELGDLMQEFFEQRGLQLECVRDSRRGLARALNGDHDLLLVDVMLPGLDGFEVLRQIRRRSAIPVIMLTARNSQVDRVLGLDAGADDYLPKPFAPEELLARIRAVLRRVATSKATPAEALEVNLVKLVPGTREVWSDGTQVAVTSTEFEILELLVRSAGRIVSRNELTAVLYQRAATPFDRSLDVHISHLRKKLGEQGSLIRTVRGIGYLFCAESADGSPS